MFLVAQITAAARELGFALPLVVAVSLVYAATRHELLPAIWRHALRVGAWIMGFLVVAFILLQVLSARL